MRGTCRSTPIIDNDSGNWVAGTGDDDYIQARGGNDQIHAPQGNNVIDGGSGVDVLVPYTGALSAFTITRYSDGWVSIQGPGVNAGQIFTQHVINVENFETDSGTFSLSGPNAVGTQVTTALYGSGNSSNNGNTGNSVPAFTNVASGDQISVFENTTAVRSLIANDPDGDTLTFQVLGTDAQQFTVSPNGNLSFVSAPDFENPSDADQNNSYSLQVSVSDGNGGSDTKQIVVSVQDVDESTSGSSGFDPNIIDGNQGNWIDGGSGDDHIAANGGNDEIYDPVGNNAIDGGTGIDKLISYEGVESDYTITRYGDGWTVIVGPGINSSTITQRVRDVEIFLPNDGAIDLTSLSIQSGTGGPSSGGASGGGGANHYDVIGPMYIGFGGS